MCEILINCVYILSAELQEISLTSLSVGGPQNDHLKNVEYHTPFIHLTILLVWLYS